MSEPGLRRRPLQSRTQPRTCIQKSCAGTVAKDSIIGTQCFAVIVGQSRGSPAVPNTPSHREPSTLSSHSGPTRTLERRFSFSLMDMADGQGGLRTGWHTGLQTGLAGSPYLPGSEPIRESLEMQKWNPLDGVRRHWQPRDEEFRHPGHVQSDGAGPYLLAATQSGSIVEEVQKAEHRLEGLQQKISNLESSLSRHKWPSGGRVAVSLADAHDGDFGDCTAWLDDFRHYQYTSGQYGGLGCW